MAAIFELLHAKHARFLSFVADQFICRISQCAAGYPFRHLRWPDVPAALNALREAAGGSSVAVLGYPVTYAIGNVLVTVAGPVVVAVIYALNH